MKTRPLLLIAALAAAPICFAVITSNWTQDSREDFEKGTIAGLSIRSDGRLSLAPAFKELYDSESTYLWAVAEDRKGNVYAGGGGPADDTTSLFVVGPDGKGRKLAELPGLQIQALAVGPKGNIYAATVPDGKVYRVTPSGETEVYFDPQMKYIWAMAFAPGGDLFVATGDTGKVFKVTPDGKGTLFFDTEEAHARSLAIDASGNLLVGSEPGGLVFRVSPAGQGFVVYQAEKREVSTVAVAPDGTVYFAAVGGKREQPPPLVLPRPAVPTGNPQTQTVAPAARPAGSLAAGRPPTAIGTTGLLPAPAGGSAVYRVAADGFTREVWSDERAIVYSIVFDSSGKPVLGTGNEGRVFRIENERISTLLLKAEPRQVTALAKGKDGRILAVTGNPGKVFQLGPAIEKEGSYESEPFDSDLFARWGRMEWRVKPNGGTVQFAARSGNLDRPQRNWSGWSEVAGDADSGQVTSPPARFLQYRATLHAAPDGQSPVVVWVDVAYQTRNVAPDFSDIDVTPANYKFPSRVLTLTPSKNLTLQPLGQNRKTLSPRISTGSSAVTMLYDKGAVGVRWLASDDNGDSLRYKVEIRGVKDSQWILLQDKLDESQYSWDGQSFPDGEYVVRVTASDVPDNPPDKALTASIVSEPFLIDNTPPVIHNLTATAAGGKVHLSWSSADASSDITKAEYSVNGEDWNMAEPVSGISDSKQLSYRLEFDRGTAPNLVIAVRVTDEFDNQAVEKTILR